MRIRRLIVFHFLFLPVIAFSQIKIDTIKAADQPEDYLFPLVRHPKASVGKKINDYLQSNVLGNTTKKIASGKLFDRRKHIMNDSINQPGITFCNFIPVLNTQKLLSVQIDYEYMAAYPSSTSQYFNFNAQNGEPIFVEDLFTANGLAALKKRINAERVKRIKEYTKGISDNKDDEFRDDLDYINERLTECLQYDTLEGFVLLKDKMVFKKSNCFPHVVQNYMTDLDVELSFAEVSNWLNDFGKKALMMKNVSIEKEYKPGIMKPFYGSIGGKYPIVLQFTDINKDGSVSGFYYYVSQGICIELTGSIKGNSIMLEESDDKGVTGNFDATYDGKLFKGNWLSISGHTALPFTLKN